MYYRTSTICQVFFSEAIQAVANYADLRGGKMSPRPCQDAGVTVVCSRVTVSAVK